MKYLLTSLALVLLTGCGKLPAMTNEAIVKETKFCEDNGMKAGVFSYFDGGTPRAIYCLPRE